MDNKTTQALLEATGGKVHQKVVIGDKAQKELLQGASILAQAVGSTMGPSGHNVIIDSTVGPPLITKDGVTVAKSIHLKNRLQSMGAELLKEVASKTNELAGDGPQPLFSKVLTPNGFVPMGNVKVGMEICGTNGSIQTVLGVYPKGQKEIYKLTFFDNRVVECCKDHLWTVTTQYGKKKTLTTEKMLSDGLVHKTSSGRKIHKYYIPSTFIKFHKTNKETLGLDPYLLGLLLGDGSLTGTGSIELSLGFKKEHAINKIILPQRMKLSIQRVEQKNHIRVKINGTSPDGLTIHQVVKSLGLLGARSDTKFIPQEYLYSSVETREKLLKGLLDTDGHINKKGLFEYSTVSEQLAKDFLELARGLGRFVGMRKLTRKPSSSYSMKPIYRIQERKGFKYGVKLLNIEPTGKFTEMQCIKVSNPDNLYLTDDYVVTHNTTTATVLAHAMLKEGIKMISTGRDAIYVKKGMDLATKEVINHLKMTCIPVRDNQDIINVGTISANGDRKIGELLAEAIGKVGQDGIITIEPGKSTQTTLEVVEGMQFDGGYLSPYFITNGEKNVAELESPFVLLTNRKISSLSEFLPILEKVADTNRALLVIADEVDGEALHTLVVNKFKGTLMSCAVKAPSYGENRTDILGDIACVVGGNVLDSSSPQALKNLKLEDLGIAKKVIVSRTSTTIVGESDEEFKKLVEDRVAGLKSLLTNDKSLDELHVDRYRKRLAKLAGGVALIKVGGSTETEILEKKDRVEDALNATIAAAQEGVVPGGGCALFYASQCVNPAFGTKLSDDEQAGVQVVLNACKVPLITIVENTGKSSDVVMDKLSEHFKIILPSMAGQRDCPSDKLKAENKYRFGYDAAKGVYGNLVQAGIIDPVKVTRCSLEHATSIVSLMLTCNAVILNDENDD